MLACETCKNEPGIGVACVPGVPYSASYGERCLRENAHPFWCLRGHLTCALSPDTAERWADPEVIDQEYIDALNTYYQDRYMTLREALTLCPPTRKELEDLDADYEKYCREHASEA